MTVIPLERNGTRLKLPRATRSLTSAQPRKDTLGVEGGISAADAATLLVATLTGLVDSPAIALTRHDAMQAL